MDEEHRGLRRRRDVIEQRLERLKHALVRVALRQQAHERGEMGHRIDRVTNSEQITGAQPQALDREMPEVAVEPRPPGDARGIARLQDCAHARTAAAAHQAEMAAMEPRQHLEDDVGLAVPPRAQNNRLVAPLHGSCVVTPWETPGQSTKSLSTHGLTEGLLLSP